MRRATSSSPMPLSAGYVAADGCCDSIRHVRAALPIDGRFHLAQRYALDWERIDGDRVAVDSRDAVENKVGRRLRHGSIFRRQRAPRIRADVCISK